MAHTPPIVQDGILTYSQNGQAVQLAVDAPDWYNWLETASTFTFHSASGAFTARKEQAGNKRGGQYWRAYRKRNGKLHRAYLGKSEDVTLERLNTIAARLSGTREGVDTLDAQEGVGAPSRASSQPSSDLPLPLTTLIGREQERAALCTLLQGSEVRLLTLTGTAGVGKTRLALEVARELVHDFADGVYFISLAPLSDPAFVMPTIAHSMGLLESGSQSLLDLLRTSLHAKHRLLLLDNFEHVLTAAPRLSELLEACPALNAEAFRALRSVPCSQAPGHQPRGVAPAWRTPIRRPAPGAPRPQASPRRPLAHPRSSGGPVPPTGTGHPGRFSRDC